MLETKQCIVQLEFYHLPFLPFRLAHMLNLTRQ